MSGDVPVAGIEVGDVLAGRYRIDRVLARGGTGVVVVAHHLLLNERIAIKFLRPELLANTDAVDRFVGEARTAVRIKSEHIARVLDVDTLDTGTPYTVMEFLEGRDLAAWLREDGALPVDQAVGFVLQACEAIAEAHALGIVHRDIKPSNLFVVRRPDGLLSVKVLDFGMSTSPETAGLSDFPPTGTGDILGSPLYMSPEQLGSGQDVDTRTDVWSLGVVLHQLVTAETPFNGETLAELFVQIATQPATSLRQLRDVPAGFELVVTKCLEKDRVQRYQNLAELATALAPHAPARARGSVQRICRTLQAAGLARGDAPAATLRPRWLVAIATVALVMIATGLRWRSSEVRSTPRALRLEARDTVAVPAGAAAPSAPQASDAVPGSAILQRAYPDARAALPAREWKPAGGAFDDRQ